MNNEERQALADHYTEKCKKAYLTDEQTEQVVAFGLDPWYADERTTSAVIDFFKWSNGQAFEREYEALTAPSGLLSEVVS